MPNRDAATITRVYVATVLLVGAALLEGAIAIPYKGVIRRVRVDVTAGTGVPGVTVQAALRKITGAPGTFDVIIAYALTADPLDSEEDLPYVMPDTVAVGVDGYLKGAFIAVATSDATADHTVEVELTIESPAIAGP